MSSPASRPGSLPSPTGGGEGGFSGFPAGKLRFTPIPAPFFTELLPQIDDLAELKVTLYAFWKLDRMEGEQRYLQPEDFSEDAVFMSGLEVSNLQDALDLAIKRGTLLQAQLELDGEARSFYFLNSARGREAVRALRAGEWKPSSDPRYPIELAQERSNIFVLYERHIGPLTPMMADALKEAEQDYPQEWLEEAVRIAVENNKRAWSYVQAILKRWQDEGRDERRTQGDSEKDRRKYVEGEFSDFIEH